MKGGAYMIIYGEENRLKKKEEDEEDYYQGTAYYFRPKKLTLIRNPLMIIARNEENALRLAKFIEERTQIEVIKCFFKRPKKVEVKIPIDEVEEMEMKNIQESFETSDSD